MTMDFNPGTITTTTTDTFTFTDVYNPIRAWDQYISAPHDGAGVAGNYIRPFRWRIRPGDEQLVYIDDNGDEWHVTVDGDGSLTAEKIDPDAGENIELPTGLLEELDKLAGVIES